MGTPVTKRVLLIGWDAADWKVINRLMDEGKMPNMEKFVSQGVMGNIATLYPDLSPMLWTSIATGKRPFNHGILGFTEPDPQGEGIRPITNLSRNTKAIWNILSQEGKKCIVVSWWPSHPAEPINGVMVSNHYQRAVAPKDRPWPMKPGTVHPKSLTRFMADLRVHPQDLDPRLVQLFVPRLAEIDQEKDRRLETLSKITADTSTVKNAALALMDREPWDFFAVYFDGIDHYSHAFMNYYPPKLDWIDSKDFEKYNLVVESGYRLHDAHLGALLEKAGDDVTTIILSDHGFHSDHLRLSSIPKEPAGPTAQHRYHGIFAIKGPEIKQDEIIYGASLLDITPTILNVYGLPIGEDMDGKPLINAFREPSTIKTIPSWDEVEGEDGMHPPDMQLDMTEAREAINQLVALGYIEKPDENLGVAIAKTIRELNYNLARTYMDAQRHTEAIGHLEKLVDEWPNEYRFGMVLAACYEAIGQIEKARPVIETLLGRRRENMFKAREKLREIAEKNKDRPAEEIKPKERREIQDLRAEANHQPIFLEYLMGSLLFAEGKEAEALEYLEKLVHSRLTRPDVYLKTGEVYLKMERWVDAEECFSKVLELDPDNYQACLGLAQSYLPRRMSKKAATAALDSVGLTYHNPRAHYTLGVALHRIGRIPRAVEALETAVSQNPNFPEAYQRLAFIHKRRLKDEKKADEYKQLAREARKRIRAIKKGEMDPAQLKEVRAGAATTSDRNIEENRKIAADTPFQPEKTVVIVSGLPRSGTSMMMQLLQAGGLSILTDSVREADDDNPKGYYEYKPVLKLKSDQSWLSEAKGKVVKIVAQLLPHLPKDNDLQYRVIFMVRPLSEVIASQKRMLERQKRKGAALPDDRLMVTFNRQVTQVRRILKTRRIPTIFIPYHECIENPAESVAWINTFLGQTLSEDDAIGVVDPELYRNRTKKAD